MRYNTSGFLADAALRPLLYVCMAALPGVLFGYDLGTLLINQNFLAEFFILNADDLNVLAGTTSLGVLLGLFVGGYLTYSSGRRISIISSSALGNLAIFASIFAPSLSVLLCSQFVIGFALGVYALAALLFVSEIALPSSRGMCTCMLPLMLLCGLIFAVLTRGAKLASEGFLLLIVLTIVNVGMIVLNIFKLPESPRYLAISGQSDAALPVLFRLRLDMGMAARELAIINECCRNAQRGSDLFVRSGNFRRLMWTLVTLSFLVNFSGSFVVPFTLADLVYASDLSMRYSYYDYTLGLIKASLAAALFAVLICAVASDRLGRRKTLLSSLAGSMLSLGFLCLTALFEPAQSTLLLSVFLLCYIFCSCFYGVVLIGMLFVELIPTRAREFGVTALLMTSTIAFLACMQFFAENIGTLAFSGFFALCLLFSAVMWLFIYAFMPNTVSASLEGIESRLLSGRKIKDLGRVGDQY